MLVEKLGWGATAFTIAHTPPDPQIVGECWREIWLERLQGNGLWLRDWIEHQHRDEFYAHGSICENYDDIDIPIYLVGGWADGYTNTILRMLNRLRCPKKGLVGPWAHKYPHFALPGPRIGFLAECLRWWDQHLKSIDTGIMNEPELQVWINHSVEPSPQYETRPGHWVAMAKWEQPGTVAARFPALDTAARQNSGSIVVANPENTGFTGGNWCGYGVVADGPIDQSLETSMASFETLPFAEDLEMLGFPQLFAQVSCDAEQANLIAVLSEVLPDGQANRISYGVLNLAHRDSHANPQPLPEEPVPVSVQLNACGQRIGKGNRLRLALSNAYWPIVWPSQSKASLQLSDIRLELPVSTAQSVTSEFASAEGAAPLETETLSEEEFARTRLFDYVSGIETCSTLRDTGLTRHRHTGIETQERCLEEYSIHPDDPNSAAGKCTWMKSHGRGQWRTNVKTVVTVHALRKHWKLDANLLALEGDEVVFEKNWSEEIPRDWV